MAQINHAETARAVEAEGTFLNGLEGGCQVPIGAFTSFDGSLMTLEGFVASVDGKTVIRAKHLGSDPKALGISLANELYNDGGREIMAGLQQQSK